MGRTTSGTLAETDPISKKIQTLVASGELFGGFRVERANARSSNIYICNETNFLALAAVLRSRNAKRPLREAYFLHLPYADSEAADGYQSLALGVAVVTALIGIPRTT